MAVLGLAGGLPYVLNHASFKSLLFMGTGLTGGPLRGSPEITEGLDTLLPVDLFIPGVRPIR